jgi:hypothetical protein
LKLWSRSATGRKTFVRRAIDTIPPREIPPVPAYQDQIASKARLLAFASPEVQVLWEAWHDAFHEIRVADMKIAEAVGVLR